jgi:uncharacterized RDD family membrane protein YckC
MSYTGSGNSGSGNSDSGNMGSGGTGGGWRNDGSPNLQPHAFDPYLQPELFRGVLTRRVIAFIIDLIVLSVPIILAVLFIAVFGVVTLGLGWALFFLVSPASVIWALVYYGATLGGPQSATIGMRVMDLELRTWYGAPGYFLLGATHAVLFWISISVLSPFVLLVGLFNGRRRLLHDVVLGTVVINNSLRSPVGQPARTY